MNLQGDLLWLIPNWGMLGMSLGWIAAAFLASTFMNHQTIEQKRLNAFKTFGLVVLLVTWAYAAAYYSGTPISPRAALLGLSGWLLFEIGDWLSYLVYTLKLSPGGPAGWFWRKLAVGLTKAQVFASTQATRTLRPTERELLARHIEARQETEAKADTDPKAPALASPAETAPESSSSEVTQTSQKEEPS